VNATDPSDPLYNEELAQVVGVIGNLGRPPIPFSPSANPGNAPLWMTSYTSEYSGPQPSFGIGALSVANEWMETYLLASSLNNAKQGAIPSGFIYEFGVDAAPLGFPNFYNGLLQANQPWSGHFSVSPALLENFSSRRCQWRIRKFDLWRLLYDILLFVVVVVCVYDYCQ
jgi:hypothetical protein